MDQGGGSCGQATMQRQAHFASLASRLRALADEAAAAASSGNGGSNGNGLIASPSSAHLSALSAELRALAEQQQQQPEDPSDAVRQKLERLVHGQADGEDQQHRQQKREPPSKDAPVAGGKKAKKGAVGAARQYDARKYGARRVLLEIAYMGERYRGFARQTPSEAKREAAGRAAAVAAPPHDDNDGTVEGALFSALRRVCLVPPNADPVRALGYSRCGRTDRGVSALGQVVALTLRSAGPPPPAEADGARRPTATAATDPLPLTPAALLPPPDEEIDYSAMLNRALPPDVRVLGWADPPAVIGGAAVGGGDAAAAATATTTDDATTPPPAEFDARFSAAYREYLYFFASPHLPGAGAFDLFGTGPGGGRGGQQSQQPPQPVAAGANASAIGEPVALDVAAMDEAARHLEGEHDFRSFCKVDMSGHVKHFVRRVLSARVVPAGAAYEGAFAMRGRGAAAAPNQHQHHQHQTFALRIRGTAFLYHQVRCIAAVLLMVGRGLEKPGVVAELLDVSRRPRKPQYALAPEQPLLLYACGYGHDDEEDEGKEEEDAGGGKCDGVVAAALPARPLACAPIRWHRSARAAQAAEASLGALLQSHLVGAAMAGAMLERVRRDAARAGAGAGAAEKLQPHQQPPHVPLLERACEPSLEERFAAQGIPTEGLSRRLEKPS
jgi:tRNA pseudouridine38/39 synthase